MKILHIRNSGDVMETFGSLCDKLAIVVLKGYHTDDAEKLVMLDKQKKDLIKEIDEYLAGVSTGETNPDKLESPSCKVYNKEKNVTSETITNDVGDLISDLACINCKLWHVQEKIYDFESVPASEKNTVIKQAAILNLERNHRIDAINLILAEKVK
jgi:hypothetical protein